MENQEEKEITAQLIQVFEDLKHRLKKDIDDSFEIITDILNQQNK
ncbi:MAG: hypothetical protein RH862_16790 [Leptospiraceae bacterium]